jgi:hypothetical protein
VQDSIGQAQVGATLTLASSLAVPTQLMVIVDDAKPQMLFQMLRVD